MQDIPHVRSMGGGKALCIQGELFLALGCQLDFRNTIVPARSEFLYAHAAAMNCNTLFVPVLWSQIESAPGRFSFSFVDRQLALAARYGLKLSLLWFGVNRGGSMRFANRYYPSEDNQKYTYQVPADIVADSATYRRAYTPDGREQAALCPTCHATSAREIAAFRAFLGHLAEKDTARTVIMIQVENEPSTPEFGHLEFAPRCCCTACTEEYASLAATLSERAYGDRTYGDYLTTLLEAGAEVYPLPFYMNFVTRPGEDIAYCLDKAPHLISCAPDIYADTTRGFRDNMANFNVGRNIPLVAETSSDTKDPTDRNLYYGVAEGGAIGYDLWAIDCAYGMGAWEATYETRTPLVDREGRWSETAYRIRDEFGILRRAMDPILRHRLTPRCQWFVGEGEERRLPLTVAGMDGTVSVEPWGRGFIIQSQPHELVLAGHGFNLDAGIPSSSLEITKGGWAGTCWIPDGGRIDCARGDDGVAKITVETPSVIRLVIG